MGGRGCCYLWALIRLSQGVWSSFAVRYDHFRQHGIVLVVQGNEPQSVFKRGRCEDRVDQSSAVTRPEVAPKQTAVYRRFGINRDRLKIESSSVN